MAVLVKGHPCGFGDLLEFAVVEIFVEIGGLAVIGDEKIWPAGIVPIEGAHGEIFAVGLRNLRGFGDAGVGAVAIVVVGRVEDAGIRMRRATGFYAIGDFAIAAKVWAESDITADVEIEFAIAIVIKENSARVKTAGLED